MKLPESIQKKLKLEPGATFGDAVASRTFYAVLEGDIAATRAIREAIEGKSTIRADEERPPIRIDISAIPQTSHPSSEMISPQLESVTIGDFYTPQPKQQDGDRKLRSEIERK